MGSNSISEIFGGFSEVLISFNFVRRSDVEMLVDSGFAGYSEGLFQNAKPENGCSCKFEDFFIKFSSDS